MIWATDAKALDAYRVWVKFSDPSAGEVDLADLIAKDPRPIVAELRDPAVFAALRVDMDTVVWDNGFDLAPEYLYAQIKSTAAA